MTNKPVTFNVPEHFLIDSQFSTHLIGFEENELHNHNFIEFTYVLQGTCDHNYNGTITTLKSGEAFLLVPSDKHQFLKNYSSDFLHRDIILTFDYFKNICNFYSDTLYESLLAKNFPLHFFLEQNLISTIESIIPNTVLNDNQESANIATKTIVFYILKTILTNKFIFTSLTYWK